MLTWVKTVFFNTYASLLRLVLGRISTASISGLPYLHQGQVRYVLTNGTHYQRLTVISDYKLDGYNLQKALADDPFWFARCKALEKNSVPDHMWKSLMLDPNISFRLDLLTKDECPTSVLKEMANKDPSKLVRDRARRKMLETSRVMRAIIS